MRLIALRVCTKSAIALMVAATRSSHYVGYPERIAAGLLGAAGGFLSIPDLRMFRGVLNPGCPPNRTAFGESTLLSVIVVGPVVGVIMLIGPLANWAIDPIHAAAHRAFLEIAYNVEFCFTIYALSLFYDFPDAYSRRWRLNAAACDDFQCVGVPL